jgi:hypothetical protein
VPEVPVAPPEIHVKLEPEMLAEFPSWDDAVQPDWVTWMQLEPALENNAVQPDWVTTPSPSSQS